MPSLDNLTKTDLILLRQGLTMRKNQLIHYNGHFNDWVKICADLQNRIDIIFDQTETQCALREGGA